MKKLLSLAIVLFIALSSFMTVSADVIFEPTDDFYTKHSSECQLVERYFTATEDTHSVTAPDNTGTDSELQKGQRLYISNSYTDDSGTVWGLIQFSDATGWIPMGYLEVSYDAVSFNEEFESQFYTDTNDLRITENKLDKLVFWDFPGSESYTEMEPWDNSYQDMGFSHSYTDPDGTVWGYVGYFYGMRGWINIGNPSSPEAPFVLERENEILYPESLYNDNEPSDEGFSPIWIAVILVAAVCSGTAALIAVLTKKKSA